MENDRKIINNQDAAFADIEASTSYNSFSISNFNPNTLSGKLIMTNLSLQGVGGVFNAMSGDKGKNPSATRERQEQESRSEFFMLILEDIRRIQNELAAIDLERKAIYVRLDELGIEHVAVIAAIAEIEAQISAVDEQIFTLRDASLDNVKALQRMESESHAVQTKLLETLKDSHPEIYAEYTENIIPMESTYATIIMDLGNGQDDARGHMIWQDANGGFYVRDPVNGHPIALDQNDPQVLGAIMLGAGTKTLASEQNADDLLAFENSNESYARLEESTTDKGALLEIHDQLVNSIAARQKLYGEELQLHAEIETLNAERAALVEELVKQTLAKDTIESEINDLNARLLELDAREAVLLAELDARTSELAVFDEESVALYAALSDKLENAKEHLDSERLAYAQTKHSEIAIKSQLNDIREANIGKSGRQPADTGIFAKVRGLAVAAIGGLRGDQNEDEAQIITYEGATVYFDVMEYAPYIIDEISGEYIFIDDPQIIADLLQEMSEGRNFAQNDSMLDTTKLLDILVERVEHDVEAQVAEQAERVQEAHRDMRNAQVELRNVGPTVADYEAYALRLESEKMRDGAPAVRSPDTGKLRDLAFAPAASAEQGKTIEIAEKATPDPTNLALDASR